MALAVGMYVVHRWATGKPAITGRVAVEGTFAVLVIALLDQGATEPVARGLAWLFFAAAAYTAAPALAKATAPPNKPPGPARPILA